MNVKIITPPIAFTNIDLDLVRLAEFLIKTNQAEDYIGGALGGRYGYGCYFKNDIFEMRPYYWGECDCGWEEFFNEEDFEEVHSSDCYQAELKKELIRNGWTENKIIKGFLDRPPNLDYDEYHKIENKIYKQLCKKHKLPMRGCAIHCTCGRDERFRQWMNGKAKEFRGHAMSDEEEFYIEGHKNTCSLVIPNFKYFKSDLEIRWYKWIGRDMEFNQKVSDENWIGIFNECANSIMNSL